MNEYGRVVGVESSWVVLDVLGQITNGVKVGNSVICSETTDHFGVILGEINSINMRYKDSQVSGVMYNENGIVDNSFVVVPDTPYDNFLAGEGNVIISTIQVGQIYGSVVGG